MAKRLAIPLLASILLTLSACNSDKEKIVKDEDVTNPSLEEQKAETEAPPPNEERITETAGLGDTRENFNEEYGEPEGDEEIANYQDDFLIVTFENHRAVNMELHFGSNPDGLKSEEEMMAFIEKVIPKDAKEVERTTNDLNSNQQIIQYKSETLKNTISEESFRGDKPGTFLVILEEGEGVAPLATVSLGIEQNK
ncbi:hypothetical protein AB1K84_18305 [Mesobacillus foraminis]|uniref:hypothetical protein n=1 Tax=Mesobacillus foraminis TaxID=279826 RepID=UPI00399F54A4